LRPAEGVNSQLVQAVDFDTALNFLFGQSLLARLKRFVDVNSRSRPIIYFALYSILL
jgi:hypothetical protein